MWTDTSSVAAKATKNTAMGGSSAVIAAEGAQTSQRVDQRRRSRRDEVNSTSRTVVDLAERSFTVPAARSSYAARWKGNRVLRIGSQCRQSSPGV